MKVRCFLASAMLAVCVVGSGGTSNYVTGGFLSLKETSINSNPNVAPTQTIPAPKVTTQQNTLGNCNINNNNTSSSQ